MMFLTKRDENKIKDCTFVWMRTFEKHNRLKDHPPEAVVLAAGFSERMGQPKALLTTATGQTFTEHCSQVLLEAGCSSVIVVIQPEHKEQILNGRFTDAVKIVVNPRPERGRFSSVLCGMAHVSGQSAVFVHNVDNPMITDSIIRFIHENFMPHYTVPIFQSKGGHPVLLGAEVVRALQHEKNDQQSLKTFLSSWKRHSLQVPFDEVLCNLNTADDVRAYLSNAQKKGLPFQATPTHNQP